MATKRNPSFEILRVIAMLLIVMWHFQIHGIGRPPLGVADTPMKIFNLISFEFLGSFAKIGTNCYILISGYFLYHTQEKWSKIAKTWAPIFFYSALLYLLFLCLGQIKYSGEGLFKALTPVYHNTYWFATKYIVLVALAPYLAIVTSNINRRQHLTLLGVLFVANFSLLLGPYFSDNNSLLWFIFLFYTGGYVRKYGNPNKKNHFGKLYFLSLALMTLYYQSRLWDIYNGRVPFRLDYHENNGIEFIPSFLLFLWATRLKVKENWFVKLLVRIAPLTFGVYLIHDNVFIRNLLWKQLIPAKTYYDSWEFVPVMFGSALAIFTICISIDFLRDCLFKWLRINDRIDSGWETIKKRRPWMILKK